MRRSPLRSPPRMRGKVWLHQKPGRVPGITPAYAGKSPPAKRKNPAIWDHPRVCGEKPNRIVWEHWKEGSPPRMRGKEVDALGFSCGHGITPAYAGKSQPVCHVAPCGEDHPRVCREKSRPLSRWVYALGSPPRMRGKVPEQSSYSQAWGITPACAGKRVLSPRLFQGDRDHPRVCGEKDLYGDATVQEWGSPPRMRGKD